MPVFIRYFGIQRSGTVLYGIELLKRSNMETDKYIGLLYEDVLLQRSNRGNTQEH